MRPVLAAAALAALVAVVPYGASRLRNGCTMTRMRPAYSFTEYGDGVYDVLRYAEWGYDAAPAGSAAVLFLPGNGGDFKQVRSLGHELADAPLAVYAADFNGELSAFDGVLLERQAAFAARVAALLRQKHAAVVLVGHSMGGVVGALAGGRADDVAAVAAVVAIAAPLAAHPFAADRALAEAHAALARSPPDLVIASVSGGARDWQVPAWLGAPAGGGGGGPHVVAPKLPTCAGVGSVDHQCLCWCNELVRTVAAAITDVARVADEPPATRAAALAARLARPDAARTAASGSALAAALPYVAAGETPWATASLAAVFLAPRVPPLLVSSALVGGRPAPSAALAAALAFLAEARRGGPPALPHALLAALLSALLAAAVAAPLAPPARRPRRPPRVSAALLLPLAACHPCAGLLAAALLAPAEERCACLWAAAALAPSAAAAALARRPIALEPLGLLVVGRRLLPDVPGSDRRRLVAAAVAAAGAALGEPHRSLEALAALAALDVVALATSRKAKA